MHNKVIKAKCKTCGKQFESEVLYERGKLHCYVDCPKCRRDKHRYLGSMEVYARLYDSSEG